MAHVQTLKLVFENKKYLALSVTVFVGLLISLITISGFVFFEPHLLLYIPSDRVLGFSLIVIVAALSALVISMSLYRIKIMRSSLRKTSPTFVGSVVGASAGACSCGSLGFAIVSIFGTAGATATSFLTNYEIPLRVLSIAIIVIAYFFTTKSIHKECKIQNNTTGI